MQGSNPSLLPCRQNLYHLSHQGNPKNTGVGSHSLFQGIFLTQRLNLSLLHCRIFIIRSTREAQSLEKSIFKTQWACIFLSMQEPPVHCKERMTDPTQGLNLYLLHQQTESLPLRHQGSPLLANHKRNMSFHQYFSYFCSLI